MNKSGIYKILNLSNNKFYIGSARNFIERKCNHYSELRRNEHKNKYLQAAWNKYSEWNFEFIVLEYVEDKTKLIEREQFWINFTNCCNSKIGYNLNPTAGSNLGLKLSEEAKNKLRSYKRTQETKDKISIANKGHEVTEETRIKIANSNRGKTRNANKERWPHGCKCKCRECKNKRNFEFKNWRLKKEQILCQ